MRYLVFNLETGAQVGDLVADPPAPAEGMGFVEVTGSYLSGLAVWNAAVRGFIEPPTPSPVGLLALLTEQEQIDLFMSEDWEIRRLLWVTASLGPARIGSPEHAGGIAVLRDKEIIQSDARRDRVLAGLPPL